jgi:ribose transport system substrate-binding protein
MRTTNRTPTPHAASLQCRKGDRNESQTVLRACEVLKAFRNHGEELVLADVVQRTQLPKTTVFRLLRTLIHGGLLERSGAGIYRNRFGPITARPFRIGFAAQGDSEFSREHGKSSRSRACPPDYSQQPV